MIELMRLDSEIADCDRGFGLSIVDCNFGCGSGETKNSGSELSLPSQPLAPLPPSVVVNRSKTPGRQVITCACGGPSC